MEHEKIMLAGHNAIEELKHIWGTCELCQRIYPHTIWHSGRHFFSYERGPSGLPIWPIEEYLARRKHSTNVRERIARLNPKGFEEGGFIRGWHPKRKSWRKQKRKLKAYGQSLGVEKAKLSRLLKSSKRARTTSAGSVDLAGLLVIASRG